MSFFDQVKSTISNIPAAARWAGAGAVGAVVLIVGATVATNAIAYERTCRGYEAKAHETIDEMYELVSRTTVLAERVERNPWAAFNVMPELMEIAGDVEILNAESQTLRSDFTDSCGTERVDRFFESDAVDSRLDEIDDMATALQNM